MKRMNSEPACKAARFLLPLVFGLGLWQCVAMAVQFLRGAPFPAPWECFVGLYQLLSGELFLENTIYAHLTASCLRWLQGFGIAFILECVANRF